METTFKERILEFLEFLKIGQTKFEENVGLGRASISKIKDGMSSPNLSKITNAYPELNMYWLISGSGEMLNSTNSIQVNIDYKEKYHELLEKSNTLYEENRELRIEIETLKRGLAEAKKGKTA